MTDNDLPKQLADAVRNQDLNRMRDLLEAGASPSDSTGPGESPLCVAARHGRRAAADLLLTAGAEVNTSGHKPLHIALAKGHFDIAARMLDHGANPLLRSPDTGMTAPQTLVAAADIATRQPGWIESAMQILTRMLDKAGMVNLTFGNGTSLVHLGASSGASAELLELLRSRGANLSQRNNSGQDPIHIAALNDNVEALDFLLDHGIDVNTYDGEGRAPLHYCRSARATQALIAHGADIEFRDGHGRTPLCHYLRELKKDDDVGAAASLLAAGARMDAAAFDGETPNDILNRRRLKPVNMLVAAQRARGAMLSATPAKMMLPRA
jgi:ankyrin repeat protein